MKSSQKPRQSDSPACPPVTPPGLGSLWSVLLCLLAVPLSLLSFAPFDQWYLAYFALVPLCLGAMLCRRRLWGILGGYIAGVTFWGLGLYWLTWITLLGYTAAVLYLGVYWLAAAAILRAARGRRWPIWIVLPVIWVGLEYAREFVIGGFPWFLLAHSQHPLTILIQVSDLTGQYGVSFFVAMVNGVLIDAALAWWDRRHAVERPSPARRPMIGLAVASACAVFLLGYGYFRLHQQSQSPGPRIGVVQQCYPISLYHKYADGELIFSSLCRSSEELIGQKCDLVVWPETMLPGPNMDPEYWMPLQADRKDPADPQKSYFSPPVQAMITDYQSYLRQLDELMGRLGCAMLIGGTMPARGCDPGERLYENAALLYTRDALAGSTARGPNSPAFRLRLANWYGKMHLVPFSEYVPGRTSWPWAFGLLRQLVPSAMSQLEPGKRPVVFTVTQGAQSWTFASPICYEGVFARVCRDLATADRRKLGVLINISNDGWFIYQGEKGTTASAELDQHLAQYKFRAVENRVPVVRAVNCGISGSIDSNGRLVEVLQRQGQRRMVSGTMVAQVLVDGRISPYSLTGDIFAQVDALAGAAFTAFFWIQRKRKQ